jgi:hypothetical protein
MKKLVVVLVMLGGAAFSLAAAEYDLIVRARNDAAEDGRQYHPLGWGVGGAAVTALPVVLAAFFADPLPVEARRAIALSAPVAGGTGLALLGYFTGHASVPERRIREIQNEYDDPRLVSIYTSEYQTVLSQIQRRKRGNSALLGFGASIGIMGVGFLVVSMTK